MHCKSWLVDASLKVRKRFFQTFTEFDLWLPVEELPCPGDIGATSRGVVLGKRMEDDLRVRSSDREDLASTFEDGPFVGIADVDGKMFL